MSYFSLFFTIECITNYINPWKTCICNIQTYIRKPFVANSKNHNIYDGGLSQNKRWHEYKAIYSTFSARAALISVIPVAWIYSGSSNGAFSIPLFPCRYFLLKHQCLGTATVLRVAFRCTSNFGSCAVTSCISTTSGRVTSCFSWATLSRVNFFNFFFDNLGPSSSSLSSYNTFIIIHLYKTFTINLLILVNFLLYVRRHSCIFKNTVFCFWGYLSKLFMLLTCQFAILISKNRACAKEMKCKYSLVYLWHEN